MVFCLALEGIGVLNYGYGFFIFIFFLFYIVSFNCNLIFKVVINVSFQNWLEIHFHVLSQLFPYESLVLFFYTEFHSYRYSKILFNAFSSFIRCCSHEISEVIEFLKGYHQVNKRPVFFFTQHSLDNLKRNYIFFHFPELKLKKEEIYFIYCSSK